MSWRQIFMALAFINAMVLIVVLLAVTVGWPWSSLGRVVSVLGLMEAGFAVLLRWGVGTVR